MDPLRLRIFLNQVAFECKCYALAATGAQVALKKKDPTTVFIHLQNLLVAAANLQKVLWGQAGKKAAQRRPVREALNVTDDSPLRNVDFRNHFEHIDERIDVWWDTAPQHLYYDLKIAPLPNPFPEDFRLLCFRVFDPETGDVVFWGDRLNIRALSDEVVRMLPLATATVSTPRPQEPTASAREASVSGSAPDAGTADANDHTAPRE